MTRYYTYVDGNGKKFDVELEIDPLSVAFERMVRRLANRARASSRHRATLGAGAIKVNVKELQVG